MGIGTKVKDAVGSGASKLKQTLFKPNPKNMNFNLSKTKQGAQSFRKTTPIDRASHSGLFRDKAKDKAGKEMRNLKAAGVEAKDNIFLAGGWSAMAGHAGVGAIGGGLAGAGVNMVRGEDAWEGAKNGAAMGAIGNGAINGSRMAIGASKGQKFGEAFGTFNRQTGMTKSVKSLSTLAKDSQEANRMMRKANK